MFNCLSTTIIYVNDINFSCPTSIAWFLAHSVFLSFLCLCLASALATSRRNEGENIAEDKREKYSGYAERTISQAVVPWEMGQILAVCERSRDEPFINYENVYFIHVDFPHLWQQLHGLYIENTILMATTAAAAEK